MTLEKKKVYFSEDVLDKITMPKKPLARRESELIHLKRSYLLYA